MLGHEFDEYVTESGRVVPLCACGWIGRVHASTYSAKGEHAAHVEQERLTGGGLEGVTGDARERILNAVRRPGRFSTGA